MTTQLLSSMMQVLEVSILMLRQELVHIQADLGLGNSLLYHQIVDLFLCLLELLGLLVTTIHTIGTILLQRLLRLRAVGAWCAARPITVGGVGVEGLVQPSISTTEERPHVR